MDYKILKRNIQKDISRALDHLGDAYTLAEFQSAVYDKTGYVVKPDQDETQLTFHRGIHVYKKNHNHEGTGLRFGVSGVWGNKIRATVAFDGHYTEKLMQLCIKAGKQIYDTKRKTTDNGNAEKGSNSNQ